MGKTAAELGLSDQEIFEEVATMDAIPDEYAPGPPAPYPSDYVFQLPKDLTHLWDKFEAVRIKGDEKKVEWVNIVFDREDPLTIVRALEEVGKSWEGNSYTGRISNKPKARGKEKAMVSDGTYLLKALGDTVVPKGNQAFINALNKQGGKRFLAFAEYTGFCNPKRQAYVQDDSGASVPRVDPENGGEVKGCGKNIYMNNWPKVDGKFAPAAQCECGAVIRPFSQLVRFRTAS